MKVMVLVVALTASAALAGAVTYVASSSQVVAVHAPSVTTPVWQAEVDFLDGTIPSEGIEADLDGNASALVASARSDRESNPHA